MEIGLVWGALAQGRAGQLNRGRERKETLMPEGMWTQSTSEREMPNLAACVLRLDGPRTERRMEGKTRLPALRQGACPVIEGRKAAVVDGLRGGEVVKTGSPRPMLLAEEKGRRVEGRRRRGGEG